MLYIIIGLLLFFIIVILILVGIYNALVALKENIKQAWANIDVILKQRYDEIPSLIEVCEQYANYESGTIDKVMSAREKMVSGKSIEDKIDGSNILSQSIGGLLALGESYPELKANQNFLQIQSRLSALEESLADRREFYNNSVTLYNTRIKQLPDVLLANMLGYKDETLFKVSEEQKARPSLKMNIK